MEDVLLWFKGTVAAVGGVVVYWLGGVDTLLQALVVIIALDYLTGVLKAVHNRTLSSEVGFRGIAKKVLCLVVVALAYVVESLTSHTLPLREVVIMFFVANEGLSILENAAQLGLPVPRQLRGVLRQIREKDEHAAGDDTADAG